MCADIVFKEKSYKIIGACFEAYQEKGNGFLEDVYQEGLLIEFDLQGVPFLEKPRLKLTCKGQEFRHEYIPAFLCFDSIIVELKAG